MTQKVKKSKTFKKKLKTWNLRNIIILKKRKKFLTLELKKVALNLGKANRIV